MVRILKDLDHDLEGLDVLLVEDIIDSGLTLNYLLKNLRARKPASLEVAALLRKVGPPEGAARHPLYRLRDPQRVRGGIWAGLRRTIPQPAVHRDPRPEAYSSG